QAEDGIRDFHVTGVQTCALPILANAPCAPGTLDMMAQFAVLSRLKEPDNSSIYSKMRVYDGENLKDVDPNAKSVQEYRDYAGIEIGRASCRAREYTATAPGGAT